ncbi:MAG TPA: DUF1501 domain-containing protein, partial [Pirellulales bacterium]|nr:DUF1501 domain-containing protein [Pirellulales bacterium]
MDRLSKHSAHAAEHLSSTTQNPLWRPGRNGIRVGSRRWFLETSLAGMAGLGLAPCVAAAPPRDRARKAVILLWLSGGPSHIDMWDPKPLAPPEIRGPYRAISTAVSGIQVCEHLPLQARIMDKLTIIRSVDCSASNHTPITMQAGNALARRTDDGNDGAGYPSMGSIAARFRGPNAAALPAFIGLADSWIADVWGAGQLGRPYEPIQGNDLTGRLAMPAGINIQRLQDRQELRRQFDRASRDLERGAGTGDRFTEMAYDMVASGKVQQAFDIRQEPDALRDAYGRDSIGEKALLARRLVEAGVTFVLVSGAWGYFDHHG